MIKLTNGATVMVCQPQAIAWPEQTTLAARMALAITRADAQAPFLGTVELNFATATDTADSSNPCRTPVVPIYYPYPYSYTGSVWYNPTTGAWARGGTIYGPYSGAVSAGTADNPATGAWSYYTRYPKD